MIMRRKNLKNKYNGLNDTIRFLNPVHPTQPNHISYTIN